MKLFQSVFFIFVMGFNFEEIFHFAKTTEFSLKGAWGTVYLGEASENREVSRKTPDSPQEVPRKSPGSPFSVVTRLVV